MFVCITFTAHALYFSVFENFKIFLGADKAGHHPIKAAFCGASAALSHDLCMTPFDTVKQRMQLGHYNNLVHCLRSIASTEGVKALYVSLPTTLLMNLPYGCIMVAVNESARKVLNPSGEYNLSTTLLSGGFAGALASVLTNPLDVIKTRLQTQSLGPLSGRLHAPSCPSDQICLLPGKPFLPSTRYTSALQVFSNIYSDSGAIGFTRGVLPRVLLHTPSVAISWTAYEAAKHLILKSV
jgi:solute carrier family 25 (mitochondrial iron transporter), member 28/37